MQSTPLEWHFVHIRKGKTVAGFASIGKPQRDKAGLDWEVQVRCDLHENLRAIPGVSPEDSLRMGQLFLKQLYEGYELRTRDGKPFTFEPA